MRTDSKFITKNYLTILLKLILIDWTFSTVQIAHVIIFETEQQTVRKASDLLSQTAVNVIFTIF